MGAIPDTIEPGQQPPMTVPLRHFLVGFGFLLVGALVGIGLAVDVLAGFWTLTHVHLLLVGWVCLTIMGAMTQFVPVWSGTTLHSHRLANAQLALVVVGLSGFATGLALEAFAWLVPFGGLLLAGFWTFVYNIARTLAALDSYDVTERHFLLSIGFFALLTVLGFLLAVDFTRPVFTNVAVDRPNVVTAHATLAVFGAVLTTVYGALYQLGTMFTRTELHGIDEYLQPIEAVGHPVGVGLLAVGRGLDSTPISRVGAVLVLVAALAFGTVLARKLYEMRVDWTPMHTRYSVAVSGLIGWALATIPPWLGNPNAPGHLFGAPGGVHLLLLGAVGFVVLGTLYHVIPFVIWLHRYSDRLGFEDVPMIDDLYDGRVAAADATLLVGGTVLLVISEWFVRSALVRRAGGVAVCLGIVLFGVNMLSLIRNHSPHSLGRILLGAFDPRRTPPPLGDPSGNEESR